MKEIELAKGSKIDQLPHIRLQFSNHFIKLVEERLTQELQYNEPLAFYSCELSLSSQACSALFLNHFLIRERNPILITRFSYHYFEYTKRLK